MSAEKTDSRGRAKVWLKPEQVQAMRATAQSEVFQPYLRDRNETLIAMLYDTGLRVGELVDVDVEMLRLDEGAVYVPTHIQKDYPTDRTPPPRTITLGENAAVRDTVTRLRSYLNNRWRDSPALFPSRQADRTSTESVRGVVESIVSEAGVRPFRIDGSRGDPGDVSPHTPAQRRLPDAPRRGRVHAVRRQESAAARDYPDDRADLRPLRPGVRVRHYSPVSDSNGSRSESTSSYALSDERIGSPRVSAVAAWKESNGVIPSSK